MSIFEFLTDAQQLSRVQNFKLNTNIETVCSNSLKWKTLIKLDATYNKYVNNNGTCIVKLKKALNGCIESAKLWYDKLSSGLIKFNYTANEYKICVFNRTESDNTQTLLVIHVDDMIVTASNESRVDDVIQQIETIYPGLTKHRGKVLNYIGMTFDFTKEGSVKMTMQGFVQDLIEEC